MRFRLGPVPVDAAFAPEQGGWRRLVEPSFEVLLLLSLPLAGLLAAGVLWAWAVAARLHGLGEGAHLLLRPATVLLFLFGLVILVAVHESLHAAALPRGRDLGEATLGFWPRRLTPYVSYAGELSRNRHILVG